MKKTLAVLGGLGVILALLLAVLVYEPHQEYRETAKRFLCIITPETKYYWGNVKAGIAQADQDLGSYTRLDLFERFDTEKQIRLLDESRYTQMDGIITLGEPYSQELNDKIQEIVASGVPVVLLDRDSPDSGRSCYIGSDNYAAGQMAAELIARETGEKSRVAVFISGMEDANQRERLSGFQQVLEEKSDMEVLEVCENQLDKVGIWNDLDRIFQEYEEINAIFSAEAFNSQQVGLWLENHAGLVEQDLTVIGFDDLDPTIELIQEGVLAATIIQDGYDMGYQAVRYLTEYDASEDAGEGKLITDVSCISKENVEEYKKKTNTNEESE